MALHIDNSQNMTPEQVKETFTNIISKSAQKAVAQGNYDRTILAKIQYCTDTSLGQYKIQYQNAYYTAYALDKNKKYSNGASVYVTVPQNNLSNRLFIQDLASNDNNQRTYLTNLEGDQQYAIYGQNWVSSGGTNEFGLSSHWDMSRGREVYFYKHGQLNNRLGLIIAGNISSTIAGGDGYFRLGADFKTNLPDERKIQSGNYGLRAVLTFRNEDGSEYQNTYDLDTLCMDGAPFEFTTYTTRYQYWEIDKQNFVRVESISGFVRGFEPSSVVPEPIDIYIKNITLHSGIKLYDPVVDYTYMVNVYAPEGFCFNLPADGEEEITSLRLEGELSINGEPVNPENQKIEFFWAKKNLAVESVGDEKYLSYFGAGWQCLNTGQRTDSEESTREALEEYSIDPNTYTGEYNGIIKWDSMQEIRLPKEQCKGRETIIKCCVRYENVTYESREYIVYNTTGYYLLLDSSHGDEPFYNGKGSTDITAGVFRTQPTQNNYQSTPVPNPFEPVSNISFKWVIENNNVIHSLPYTAPSDLLLRQPDWESNKSELTYSDTPAETNANVEVYLNQLSQQTGIEKVLLKNCYERYLYYTEQYQNNDDPTSQEYINAKNRVEAILTDWQAQLDKYYTQSFENDYNLCILGPSKVYPKWTIDNTQLQALYNSREDPHDYAAIDHIVHMFNDGSQTYSNYQRNTLYKLQAKDIVQQMKVSVTAILTEVHSGVEIQYPLETKDIYLNNEIGNGLDCNLQITNGTQTFVYDAGGKKPKISIKTLSFKLFDNNGSLVFDSASAEEQEARIEELKPEWKFYNGNTLLVIDYVGAGGGHCEPDSEIPNRYIVYNEPLFRYNIAEDYNVNYKERSQIELMVTYQGAKYTASTSFTFSKQGDLGTNGTNMTLDIQDQNYEEYRSDVLSRDEYSKFSHYNGDNNAIYDYYYPEERHLKSTYLYATKVYNADGAGGWAEIDSFADGRFCNLKFAQSASYSPTIQGEIDLNGSVSARLDGYWVENGTKTLVDSSSQWSVTSGSLQSVRDQTKIGRAKVYDRSSFEVNNPGTGSSAVITLEPPVGFANTGEVRYYKPMDNIKPDDEEYEWTAYNVVQCKAVAEVRDQLDPYTGKPMKRTNYGYYQIPFFYFGVYERDSSTGGYSNITRDGLDPARHFVVYGGYDEIIYGADGVDPQYNKQTPFTFRLIDENGVDITEEALASETTSIIWDNSYGLSSSDFVKEIKNYEDFLPTESLLYKYCIYDNNTYYCIKEHHPSQKVEILDSEGNVIKTYNENGTTPYDFVTPYWEQVSPNVAKNKRWFNPPPTYEACAVDTLFSSWVSIKVIYYKGNKKYEGAALLPVNILQNVYGSDEINAWDGKKTVVDDGYILSNKIAAGYKDDTNAFIGITLGTKMITNGIESTASSEDQIECGLFGYGKFIDANQSMGRAGYGQTLFLDARTGLAAFGPRGSTQIILNPRIPKDETTEETWSRLAGWYFSRNYLYKPLWVDNSQYGQPSYIDENGDVVRPDGYRKDYYDTEPPDANNALIPGSVGLYVPSTSKDTSSITADTVFLWASAAADSDADFVNNGSFTALSNTVNSIDAKFNESDFPIVYTGCTSVSKEVTYVLSHNFMIDNINELAEVYSDCSTLMTYISNYQTAFNRLYMAVGDQEDQLGLSLVNTINAVRNIVNRSSFPVVQRNGKDIKPDVSQVFTITNVDELKKWYLESNEPAVTSHTSDLSDLNTELENYEYYRTILANNPDEFEDVHYAIGGVADATSVIKSYMNTSTFNKRTKMVADWDTSTAIRPVINQDTVTIDNLTTLQDTYARAAYLASETDRDYITDINDLLSSYSNLHSGYTTWQDNWKSQTGAIVGYKSSNEEKKKANFSVTYGGKLHCNEATITGNITATSGHIGIGNNSIGICEYHDSRFYLLYNSAFRVSYTDSGVGIPVSEVFVDGTINARSGKIGNTSESADGSDKHTVFMEYNWYPRRLPDSHSRWGDGPNYRDPTYDQTQGTEDNRKIVKYSLWSPYFSVIDDPNGAVNKAADGTSTDFTYQAGDAVILGRIYATGGRIGDWVLDNDGCTLRDPYQTIRFKPNNRGPGHERQGYVQVGRTIIYGDGSIDGGCQTDPSSPGSLPTNPTWTINSNGVCSFANYNSTYHGSLQTSSSGGSTIDDTGVTTTGSITVTGSSSETRASNSATTTITGGSASFGGTITASSFTADTNSLSSGGLSINSNYIREHTARLPDTSVNSLSLEEGNIAMNNHSITSAASIDTQSLSTQMLVVGNGGITTTSINATQGISIGGMSLDLYIRDCVRSWFNGRNLAVQGDSGTTEGHEHAPGAMHVILDFG